MPFLGLSLIKRSTLNRKMTAIEMDQNLTDIEKFINATYVTYTELLALIAASALLANHYYMLSDYATAHYIPFTDSHGDGTGMDEEVNVGPTEPLLLYATSGNTLDRNAYSFAYPNDTILYNVAPPMDRFMEYCMAQGKGLIYKRIDNQFNLERDYDWRAVVFRRWKLLVGSTLYLSITPTAFAHQDFTAFTYNDIGGGYMFAGIDVKVGSPGIIGIVPLAALCGGDSRCVYQLDNVVFLGWTWEVNITVGYGETFVSAASGGSAGTCAQNVDIVFSALNLFNEGMLSFMFVSINSFIQNTFNTGCDEIGGNDIHMFASNIVSGHFKQNNITAVEGNTFGEFSDNTGIELQGNTARDIKGNVVTALNNNNIGTGHDIIGNVADSITHNTCQDITGCVADDISYNVHTGALINLTMNACSNNTGVGNVENSNGLRFSNNILAGNITMCEGVNIIRSTITAAIATHSFITSNIDTKTITPTANMSNSAIPTASRYDIGITEHVEEILTSGVMSWSAAFTS